MDRGQAHTLEAFTAGLLVVTGVIFALEATAVTPLSASTSNQHIENQQKAMAEDLLTVADVNGTLLEAVTYWNATEGGFVGTSTKGFYTDGGPPTAFGQALNDTFDQERVAFNVYVLHWDAVTESYKRETMVYMGAPSDNAIVAQHSVVLYNDTMLSDPNHAVNVSEASVDPAYDFYATDSAPGSSLFNVLEVRIVIWRM